MASMSPSPPPQLIHDDSTEPPPSPPQPHQPPPIATPLLMAPHSAASSRRLPPPCWTPEETSALIDAYRDKWYALRRGNLRAAHWQEVADDVHCRCPAASLPKTAVQCRHKMEKLRKRYRAELQRARSLPHHRFSSSWVCFLKMDSMEKGTSENPSPAAVSLSSIPVAVPVAVAEGFHDVGNDDDDDDDDEDNSGGVAVGGGVFPFRGYDPRRDFSRDFHGNGLRIRIPGSSTYGLGFQSKRNYGDFDDIPNPNPNPNPSYEYKSKFGNSNYNTPPPPPPPQYDEGARVVKNGSSSNGSGSQGMATMMKKKRKRERGEEAAMEMVEEAIRVLGEGFVRMEKMKMEMVREMERMKMEMEMKRTEMILESQHRIVEFLAKGWSDLIKKNNKDAC